MAIDGYIYSAGNISYVEYAILQHHLFSYLQHHNRVLTCLDKDVTYDRNDAIIIVIIAILDIYGTISAMVDNGLLDIP